MLVSRPLGEKTRVFAYCDSADSVGDLVYVSDAPTGTDYTVTKADVSQTGKMPSIGCIIAKPNATRCVVQLRGEVLGVYTGLIPGQVYFVGADARPSGLPPTPGIGARAYVQPIGVAAASNVLLLDPQKTLVVRVG